MHRIKGIDNGSYSYAEELLERGDKEFLAEIRRVTHAERLGKLAGRWYDDRRPEARQLLLDYLDLPLNAFRHEPLVKRLFKQAEAAGDDEVMGRFLVALDRSVRRVLKRQRRTAFTVVDTNADAQKLAAEWEQQGYETYQYAHWEWDPRQRRSFQRGVRVIRSWTGEVMRHPKNTEIWKPRDRRGEYLQGPYPISDADRQQVEERQRLFSIRTRNYLRRRAWRYFRTLGKRHPVRYLPAVVAALKCYRDEDVATGLALIDNWGLVHILFHHSPVLESKPRGWRLAAGRGLSQLAPAPAYESLWQASPRALLELLLEGQCRAVRQWAVHMIRREHAGLLKELTPEELFGMLARPDAVVAELAVEVLRGLPDLSVLGVDRLLALVEDPHPETLEIICTLLADRLGADRVTFSQAVRLAASRPLPAARLGFLWLRAKSPSSLEDCQALLGLTEAQAEPLRPEIVSWARGVLSASPFFQPEWVLEYLDSRHADVRAEGWTWLESEERVATNTDIWRKLLESPYDEVRLKLVAALEKQARSDDSHHVEAGRLDEDLLRFVWAAVLLNIHRGGRTKPVVLGQIVRRLQRRPEEASALLPILAVALRSVRGPEWRAGLTAVVQVGERHPELHPLLEEHFPELVMVGSSSDP